MAILLLLLSLAADGDACSPPPCETDQWEVRDADGPKWCCPIQENKGVEWFKSSVVIEERPAPSPPGHWKQRVSVWPRFAGSWCADRGSILDLKKTIYRCAFAEHRKERVKIFEGTFGITINSGESLVKIVPNSLPWLAVCIDRHIKKPSTNQVPKGPCEVKVALFIDDGVGRHPAQRVNETKECPQ
ncbi:MAG: hypothetical protein A2289_26220 [Deltaproteobacteria bacterium RIFOXYA12_FULL_58_15]|nr:MAG: hypothetical protein A2289_26220 [Deltaproteobacteria bacterium RIFOXYA12_FULL_58_15]OGR13843.1 MAG: hypothetical protein A2341_01485 [Deltaproteobacteria bacterium RIFOXYB12_FULL_58_9]